MEGVCNFRVVRDAGDNVMIDLNSMNPTQKSVYLTLCDLEVHTSPELLPICNEKTPRDIINGLRKKGFLIHGRGNWRLDERHILDDEKARLLATAEEMARHSSSSLKLAKRGAERVPIAFELKQKTYAEVERLRNSPDTKGD